jgi:hypothetical protein
MCTGYGRQKFEQILLFPIVIFHEWLVVNAAVSLERDYNLSKVTFRLPFVFSIYKRSRLCSIRNSKWINISISTRTTPHIHWEHSDYIIIVDLILRTIKVCEIAGHVLICAVSTTPPMRWPCPETQEPFLCFQKCRCNCKLFCQHVARRAFKRNHRSGRFIALHNPVIVQSSSCNLSSPTSHSQLCMQQHYLGINSCISVRCCLRIFVFA